MTSVSKIVYVPYYAHEINLFLLNAQLKYSFIITNACLNDLDEIITFIIKYYSIKKKTNNKKHKNKIIKNLDLFIKTISNLNLMCDNEHNINDNMIDIVQNYNLFKHDLD